MLYAKPCATYTCTCMSYACITMYMSVCVIKYKEINNLEQLKKFVGNPILIRMSSKFLHNVKNMYMYM